ncbi:MAG: hypothetical protein WCJ01_01960 [Ignavibacteria bacterium]
MGTQGKKLSVYVILSCFIFLFDSCSVYQTFQNISRLKFKLGEVNGFIVDGVSISNKSGLQDFSAMDILKLTAGVANRRLPVSFIVNVNALNPDDGKGGYPGTDATLKSFPWRLMIDDKETIAGNISSAVSVPGTGEAVVIPIKIEMDLFKYFQDKGYQGLLDLALKIGGQNKDPLKIKLAARPTVSSLLGDITYPKEIVLVQTEYK